MSGLLSAIALFFKQLSLLVSYVKNNAFPQPLSEQEEEKHLRQMAEGKDTFAQYAHRAQSPAGRPYREEIR